QVRVDGDREHHEALLLVSAIEALHRRHLLTARCAPRRPEVDHDRLAPLLTKPEGVAAHEGHSEVVGQPRARRADQIELARRLVQGYRESIGRRRPFARALGTWSRRFLGGCCRGTWSRPHDRQESRPHDRGDDADREGQGEIAPAVLAWVVGIITWRIRKYTATFAHRPAHP